MRIKNPIYILGAIIYLLAMVVMGCEHVGPLEPEAEHENLSPTLSELQSTIFTPSCAVSGCHVGSNPVLGLDLSDGNSFANIVGVTSRESTGLKLVEPGQPENSYLVIKIEGGAGMMPGTMIMPLGRPALSDQAIEDVKEWIRTGALDN